jgi:hypothetical protein
MRKSYLQKRLARITRSLAILVDCLVDEMPDDEPLDLPPMEAAILEALEDGKPQPGKRLAKLAGYSYSARLRTTLADMTRRSLLNHSPDGYKIASQNGHSLNGTHVPE